MYDVRRYCVYMKFSDSALENIYDYFATYSEAALVCRKLKQQYARDIKSAAVQIHIGEFV